MRRKKSSFYFLILTLFLTFNLISCSGGGGDGTISPTTIAGFIKTVQATGAADGYNIGGNASSSARYMLLYRAQDIQASGMISIIRLKRSDAMSSSINCPNVTVKMGHTDVTGLDITFANNIEQGQGAFTTVINNASINVPAGAADTYFDITLPQAFNYNGVDNLIVEITRTSACTGDITVAYHGGYDGANMNDSSSTATTGTVHPYVVDARFVFSGGDNITVGLNGSSGSLVPFGNEISQRKVQLLYTAAEINGSGTITGIAFPPAAITNNENYTINVRLGHTTLSQLTTNFANNFNSGTPVTVASGVNFRVPGVMPVDSYIWIPLPDASFTYNGTSNLIVEIEVTASSGQTFWRLNMTPVNGRLLWAAAGAATGTVQNDSYYCIKFRFDGGTMDVITPGESVTTAPFWGSNNNKLQYLYRAAELGSRGTITGLAIRLDDDSVASSYNNFVVVLGYAAASTLGTTFASNMTGAQTVYSGTFTVPAGLKAGDWIEIPLGTSFNYDGERDLVVQTSNLAGTLTNNAIISVAPGRYLNRYALNGTDNTAATADGVYTQLGDLRLTIQ